MVRRVCGESWALRYSALFSLCCYTSAAVDSTKETRRLRISNVIVKPEDVRNLAKILVRAGSGESGKGEAKSLSFWAGARDNSEYEGATPEVYAEGGILDRKEVHSIGMSFSNYASQSRVRIRLTHASGDWGTNEVEVTGGDSNWVNGTMRLIEDSIQAMEPQAEWPRKYFLVMVIAAALGIGRLYLWVIGLVLDFMWHPNFTQPPEWLKSFGPMLRFLDWGIALFVGLSPARSLLDKLIELWPVVELRMGREWTQISRRRRERLWLVISVTVLPLLVNLLYGIMNR